MLSPYKTPERKAAANAIMLLLTPCQCGCIASVSCAAEMKAKTNKKVVVFKENTGLLVMKAKAYIASVPPAMESRRDPISILKLFSGLVWVIAEPEFKKRYALNNPCQHK